MNKKLFLAGVALLAAVGFTSCNSETPIDPSTPSGIAPAAVGHQVGVDYDWAVKAKDVAQFNEYWADDQAAVQALVKDKKIASICFIADAFTLEKGGKIEIPQLWTAGAAGKIVNIRVAGEFKNPDFLREDWLKNGVAAKKWPVQISTKNLKGAEVNITFDAGKFDLELESEYTRTTINGDYAIGYTIVNAAEGMSATEFQSGYVTAIDIASSGDVKELNDAVITGVWTDGKVKVDVTAEKGIYVGTNKYIKVENVFVEEDATINNLAYNSDPKKTFKLGAVVVVNPNKNVTVTFAEDKIYAEAIVGTKADKNFMTFDDATINLNYVDAIADITVKGATTLIQDVCTGVIFNDAVTFNTEKVSLFDNVTFNALNTQIHADDVTVTFDGVNFLQKPTLSSSLEYIHTAATTKTDTYQWVISATDPKVGQYEVCKNDLSDLKEYNKGKEPGKFASSDLAFSAGTFTGKKAEEAKTYDIVVIITPIDAEAYTITPEGTEIDLTAACKFLRKKDGKLAQTDEALNDIWGNAYFKDEGAWYSVKYADIQYIWKKISGDVKYVLIKE
jgi:hypothetical protein